LSVFKTIPFFKLLIPFVLGILFAIEFNYRINVISLVTLFIISSVLFFLQIKNADKSKLIYLFFADLFLFLFGFLNIQIQQKSNNTDYYSNKLNKDSAYIVIAKLNDVISEKEKTFKCPILIKTIKINDIYVNVDEKSFCYIKKNSLYVPKIGEDFIFKAKPTTIQKPLNPNEFNYQLFLQRKNIYNQFFIDSSCISKLVSNSKFNIVDFSLKCKLEIINRFKNGLKAEHAAICSALITGYDDDIDKETISQFSNTGTLHVLSVSGLHTGLIYLIVIYFFNVIDSNKKIKIIRLLTSIIVLWLFALLTGFSAPVLRAVLMLNLIGVGNLYFRNRSINQLNILCFSAFLLLTYNPFYFFDVGFQLSYWAMFGLIFLQPKLQLLYLPKNYVIKNLINNVYSSISATLTTLPITLYFFHQFPLWFIICNIIIIPLTSILLFLCLIYLFNIKISAVFITILLNGIIYFINLFDRSSIIDLIDFKLYDMLFLIICFILLNELLKNKKFITVASLCFLIISWQLINLFSVHLTKSVNLITVYQITNQSTILVKSGNSVNYNQIDTNKFNYHIKPHLITFNYSKTIVKPFNYIKTNNEQIVVLSQKNKIPIADYNKITILILQNNFRLNENYLNKFKNTKQVIIDGSINFYNSLHIEKLCRKFDISLYSTKANGAFLKQL
jgi:competence protein ComEC